jgi:hypothetical protein
MYTAPVGTIISADAITLLKYRKLLHEMIERGREKLEVCHVLHLQFSLNQFQVITLVHLLLDGLKHHTVFATCLDPAVTVGVQKHIPAVQTSQ